MKMTIVIDKAKLKQIMHLTGMKTRQEVVDCALDKLLHTAQLDKVFSGAFYEDGIEEVIDPSYDMIGLRNCEQPKSKCTLKRK